MPIAPIRPLACLLLLALACAYSARAVTVREDGWAVHYNFPDQDTFAASSGNPNEWAIRDALLARINALTNGQEGFLSTYTFSGDSTCCGAAGPILTAVNGALNRGATMHMVIDNSVSKSTTYGSYSLNDLTNRVVNPLDLEEESDPGGIMHHKLGLFDYGPSNRWVFVASWNFTGGASSLQWNIGLEVRDNAMYAAYKAEFAEFLAGRFHDNPAKSHAHDRSTYSIPGAWGTNVVRFGPYPTSATGGNNALTDVTNAIRQAKHEIVFALNKLTRTTIRDQLIAAANRGVAVYGSMPRSDTDPGGDSDAIYSALTNSANYTTTNVVHMLRAFAMADWSALDAGESELIHAKYMVIDPFGANPLLIHGSANWTASALSFTNTNDENINFIRHRDIARIFYADFKRITGAFQQRNDFWWDISGTSTAIVTRLWATDTNSVVGQTATNLSGPWAAQWTNATGVVGYTTRTNLPGAPPTFFRALRSP